MRYIVVGSWLWSHYRSHPFCVSVRATSASYTRERKVKTSRPTSVFWDGRLSTHADPARGQRAGRIDKCTGHAYDQAPYESPAPWLPQKPKIGSDFGLLLEQSFSKWEIPCPGHRWTAVQNLTPRDLSSAGKSLTVQTNKQTKLRTVNELYPHLAYRHVWIMTAFRWTLVAWLSGRTSVFGRHTFCPALDL